MQTLNLFPPLAYESFPIQHSRLLHFDALITNHFYHDLYDNDDDASIDHLNVSWSVLHNCHFNRHHHFDNAQIPCKHSTYFHHWRTNNFRFSVRGCLQRRLFNYEYHHAGIAPSEFNAKLLSIVWVSAYTPALKECVDDDESHETDSEGDMVTR